MSEPGIVVLRLSGRIAPADVRPLCERAHTLLEGGITSVVVCDVDALVEPDASAVDAVARLQLVVRRRGREMRVRGASQELRDLLALAGLLRVVPLCDGLLLETRGQAEQREQPLGIEEERDAGNPIS